MNATNQKKLFLFLLLVAVGQVVFAHTVNYELANAPLHDVIGFYMKLGIQHIIPYGLDHIVFVVGLCLLSTKFKSILLQATAFTVAHSVTLALSMKGVITLPSSVVEPI